MIVMLLCACNPLDMPLSTGISRLEAYGSSGRSRQGGWAPAGKPETDTSIVVSGVEFPDNYDWQRDTAYGNVCGNLVLFRDGERVTTLAAGLGQQASLAADMHCLSQGHLLSWNVCGDRTVVLKDGKKLLDFPGKEVLKGLLERPDGIYTLGQESSGNAFSLRKDGIVLLSEEGRVYRSLYEDEGHLYFGFVRDIGESRARFLVTDGAAAASRSVTGEGEVLDELMHGGVLYQIVDLGADGTAVCDSKGGQYWLTRNNYLEFRSLSLIEYGSGVAAEGLIVYNSSYSNSVLWTETGEAARVSGDAWFYLSEDDAGPNTVASLYQKDTWSWAVLRPDRIIADLPERCFLPSRGIGVLAGSTLYLALSPLGGKPYIWSSRARGDVFEINGFLTGIELVTE